MTEMIRLSKVYKIYRTIADEVAVFKGLDVVIKEGVSVAIIGESGCGKTTLLNLMSGLDIPSGGEIYLNSVRIDSMNEEKLSEFRNEYIGFIFQHHNLIPDFNALDNALIPIRINGKKSINDYHNKAYELFEKIGLKDRMSHYPDQLSGGEKQRVAIVRALINNPKVIFADEPTGSLDKNNAANVEEMLFELKDEMKKTFVIATHNLEIAKKCDFIIDLNKE